MANFYGSYPPSGSGGGSGSAVASATTDIGNAASSIAITYSTTLTTAYPPIFSFLNIVDATPIALIGWVSAFSTTGCTITFNAPTDSANYKVKYAVFGEV